MDAHAESEVRGHAVGDVAPGVSAVVAAVQAPVVLQVQPPGPPRVMDDLVDALAELGMLVRQELGAYAAVPGVPRDAAVVRPVDAAGRGRDREAPRPRRVHEDRVQAQAAAARRPLRAVRVVPEARVERPRLAGVVRGEERRGLDAAIERVGLVVAARRDLPDVREGRLRLGRKAHERSLGPGPGPCRSRRSRPAPLPSACSTARPRDGGGRRGRRRRRRRRSVPGRRARSSASAGGRGPDAQQEEPLHRPDHQQDVAVLDGKGRGRRELLLRHGAEVYCVQRR